MSARGKILPCEFRHRPLVRTQRVRVDPRLPRTKRGNSSTGLFPKEFFDSLSGWRPPRLAKSSIRRFWPSRPGCSQSQGQFWDLMRGLSTRRFREGASCELARNVVPGHCPAAPSAIGNIWMGPLVGQGRRRLRLCASQFPRASLGHTQSSRCFEPGQRCATCPARNSHFGCLRTTRYMN